MNDAQVMAFLTVADTLNFTKAANQLYLTQQAVSKYINEMEKSLNIVLFERTKTEVKLTAEGESLCRLFRETAYDFHKTREKIENYYRQLQFKLRIGISETLDPFGAIWDGVGDFISAHPNTVFNGGQCMVSSIQSELECGKYDVVIAFEDNIPLGDEFKAQTITREQFYLYGPVQFCGSAFDEKCWGLPFIQQASWEWGYLAWNKIGLTRLAKLNIRPERCLGVPNAASLAFEMSLHRYTTMADSRFSYVNKIPGLARFPVDKKASVCVVWNRRNENALITEFASKLHSYYSDRQPKRSPLQGPC